MSVEVVYSQDGVKVQGDEFEGDLIEGVRVVFGGDVLAYLKKLVNGELLVSFQEGDEAAMAVVMGILGLRGRFFEALGLDERGVVKEGGYELRSRLKEGLVGKDEVVEGVTGKVLRDVLATIKPHSDEENFWGFGEAEVVPIVAYWFAFEALKVLHDLQPKATPRSRRITTDDEEGDWGGARGEVWEIVKALNSIRLGNLLLPIVKEVLNGRDGAVLWDLGAGRNGLVAEVLRCGLGGDGVAEVKAFDLDEGGFSDWQNIGGVYNLIGKLPTVPKVERMNVLDIGFKLTPDNSVDVIICSNLLHKLPVDKHEEFMRDVYRILKPGGVVILNMPWHHGGDTEGFYRACDGTDYPEAILSVEASKQLMTRRGFVIGEGNVHELGFKAGTLDGFAHGVIVGRKPWAKAA